MDKTWQIPLMAQNIRRLLVLGCYGGYTSLVVAWIFTPQPFRSPLTLILGLVCIICMGLLLMPNLLGISGGLDRLLDERQREFRNRMYIRAYQILGFILVILGLYTYIAVDLKAGWLPKSSLELQAVFWAIWIVVMTLPTALISWFEPNALQE